jgi:hypothetical protein
MLTMHLRYSATTFDEIVDVYTTGEVKNSTEIENLFAEWTAEDSVNTRTGSTYKHYVPDRVLRSQTKKKRMVHNHATQAQALGSEMAELGNLLQPIHIITDNPQADISHLGIPGEDRMGLVAIANTAIETATDSDGMDPSAYKEAMQSSERNRWQEAIREELESSFLNNAFILPDNNSEIGPMPPTAKALSFKWIIERKLNQTIRYGIKHD